jgi:hypothetical protein
MHGSLVLAIRTLTKLSDYDLVNFTPRCFAPAASAMINNRLISVCAVYKSSNISFSVLEVTFAELFREEACSKEGILHGHIS